MGKDKGVFPFRKHSVGNHLYKRKLKKGMGVVLAAALLFNTLPSGWLTAAASEGGAAGLCEHHTEHTADCGYREAAPCTHEHTDGCYTEKMSCVHEHDADCYGGELPAEGEDKEVVSCTHVCTEDSGCITRELNCTHEHDGSCGYAEAAPCGYVCEICNGEEADGGQETSESGTGGESAEENKTEEDTMEESTSEENDTGENVPEEESEEGLCPHHEKHTEDCGYGEDMPCGYECKICPVQELIDALPDAEEITAENAADVEEQLAGIDEAKAELTDEELDITKYEAAVSALLALKDMEGADKIQTLADGTISESDTIWENGTYTVASNITLTSRVEVKGDVTLVLNAGCKLTASKGIAVTAGNSLTIEGEGTLEAKGGTNQAGIGGNYQSDTGGATGGTIRITGGTITATGGNGGAGIGGGSNNGGSSPASGGTIEISGGTVIATGNFGGAGIGGGVGGNGAFGGAGGTIEISGGTVTATGGNGGAGIGGGNGNFQNGGDGGTITISGNAHVEATGGNGGAGIGGGKSNSQNGGDGGTITISGSAHVEATGSNAGAGIGGGDGGTDGSAGTIQIGGGAHVKAGGSSDGAGVGGNGGEITIDGDGTYVEAIGGGNSAGIGGGNGSTGAVKVEIDGGTIDATGSTDNLRVGGAGIGSGGGSTGPVEVTISGGTVTATGGSSSRNSGGAGIGSGGGSTGTVEVTINGGTIDATGGGSTNSVSGGGAGIGSGGESTGTATVTIDGGTVTATGGGSTNSLDVGAGIGAGGCSDSATFSTGESGSAWIVANGGSSSSGQGAGIGDASNQGSWSGVIFQNGAGELYGGKYSLSTAAEVPNGATLAIPAEAFLTVENGTALTVDGTINNSGTLTASGTLDGSGTLSGGGKFYTTNVTADMITVPTGLFFEDKDWIDYIGQNTTLATKTYCGKEFQVTGWTQSVTKVNDLEYTVTYTPDSSIGGTAITKTVTLRQSGTTLTATLKDNKTDYAYSDTITINASVKASGKAPNAPAMLAANFTEPTAGDAAVYDKDGHQICDAATALRGVYTFTIPAKTLGAGTHELTVKFIESTVMAGAEATVEVTVAECPHTNVAGGVCDLCGRTIVAQVEIGGTVTPYTSIVDAWNAAQGKTATITMLQSQTINEMLEMTSGNVTLTMASDVSLTGTTSKIGLIYVTGGTLTLDGCTIESQNEYASVVAGGSSDGSGSVVNIRNCDISGQNCAAVYNDCGTVNIYSGMFKGSGKNTYGLFAWQDATTNLYGGTFSGESKAIQTVVASGTLTVGDLLADGYAYKQDGATWISGDALSGQTLTGTVEVKPVPVTITKQPTASNAEPTYGDAVTLSIEAKAADTSQAINYKWYDEEGTEVYSEGNTGFLRADMNVRDYIYYCDVTCDGYTVTSGPVAVHVAKRLVTVTAKDQTIIYGGNIQQGVTYVEASNLVSGDVLAAVTLTQNVNTKKITPSAAEITRYNVDRGDNYDITYKAGQLTIEYLDKNEVTAKFNGAELADTPWFSPATQVTISASGFTVAAVTAGGAHPADSAYDGSITMPAGDVAKMTFYFKQTDTGYMTDGIQYTLKIDDNPPGGKITIGTKWWQTLLNAVTFGHYAAKEYTVTIEADDTDGSGIEKVAYAIVEGDVQYTDADRLKAAAGISWTEYKDGNKPEVPVDSKCVVYARLTDQAGNVTYISTEGILLDKTPPTVDGLAVSAVETRTADITFTVNEAADHYYAVLPESAAVPAKEDIVAGGAAIPDSAASGKGEVTEGQLTGGAATVKVTVSGLTPGMSYKVYVTAVDKTVDLDTGAPAGNVGEVKSSDAFTMKKLDQAMPAFSYSYKTDEETGEVTVTINEVTGAEYSFDGGQNWGDANEMDGFNESQTVSLAIRMKETDTHNPSPAQTVAVNLAKEAREAPPKFNLQCEPNGETDYTVTIPPTEGCEYSFDGVTWSDENVKTGAAVGETVTGYKRYKENDQYNASGAVFDTKQMQKFTVKTPVISPAGGTCTGSVSVTITCASPDAVIYYTTDGNTPTRSSARYTGAFTVTPTITVKAIAIKEGFTDSAVATAQYTKKDSGGSGHSGSSSKDKNKDDNESKNTAPAAPVTPPAPGAGTRPGTGNTAKPGNSTVQEVSPDTEKPFIKGENGKTGWDVIRAREEKTEDGNTINVDMNGASVVPGDIFDRIKGRDVTITFDMDNGILWSVDGKSVTTGRAGDIDFSVKAGTKAIPVDIVNNVTGENYSIQISLAHEGEFGFTAVLSIGLGRENAGHTANLYYYNEKAGELEFICADEVAEDGTAELAFTHASDYLIAIDTEATDEKEETDAPSETAETDDNSTITDTEAKEDGWGYLWIFIVGAIGIVAGLFIFFIRKKEKEE